MQTAAVPARTRPFPLPGDIGAEQARSVVRAATALALRELNWSAGRRISAEEVLSETWPSDHRARGLLTRTATAAATTSTAGWASQLAITTTGAFLGSLSLASAAAQLFAAAVRLSLDGVSTIRMPFAASTPALAGAWTAEGSPIVVRQASFTTMTLGPTKKLSVIAALTNEIADHSTPVAETVIRQTMVEHTSRVLDQSVFSNVAGDATRPPGILYNVTPITAATGGGQAALLGDLKALLAALTNAGAGQRVMIFAPPAQLASIAVYVPGGFSNIELIPTIDLASTNSVVALDPAGVFSAYSGDPEIDVSKSATLHYEGANPLDLATGVQGSATLASPSQSLFQTDAFALKLILRCAWAVRPGFVQTVSGVSW